MQDLTGQKFGKLVALNFHERRNKKRYMWNWQCDCGNTQIIDAEKVKNGRTSSCGCLRDEVSRQNRKNEAIHGLTRTPEYASWSHMRRRCYDPENKSFKDYGGRGISVCDRWNFGENGLHGVECFLIDMGKRPFENFSIERKDVNENYTPDNCVWASKDTQIRNKRNNIWVVYQGRQMILKDAIRMAGSVVSQGAVHGRLKHGWVLEEALETPAIEKFRNKS